MPWYRNNNKIQIGFGFHKTWLRTTPREYVFSKFILCGKERTDEQQVVSSTVQIVQVQRIHLEVSLVQAMQRVQLITVEPGDPTPVCLQSWLSVSTSISTSECERPAYLLKATSPRKFVSLMYKQRKTCLQIFFFRKFFFFFQRNFCTTTPHFLFLFQKCAATVHCT